MVIKWRVLSQEYRKPKRLLKKEKVSFKKQKIQKYNNNVQVKKTGDTKEICPNQIHPEIR